MKKTIFKEVAAWGKKVGTNVWNSTKDAPGKAKNIAKDQFSKIHQSDSYKRASHAMSEMSAMSMRDVGKKLTTKTGIGIMAGTGGAVVGYSAVKKKNKKM